MIESEQFLKHFRLPRRYVFYIWSVVFFVILIGILISTMKKDWLWLARFGSFIVIASMILEAFGIVEKFMNKIMKIVKELTREVVRMQLKRLPHLFGVTGNETKEQFNDMAEKELRRRIMDVGSFLEKSVANDLRRTQFLVASVGTLLWAFADLLNQI